MGLDSPRLCLELEHRVQLRTGRRVRNLAIELDRECIVLHGLTNTYYVKQLAQHEVRAALPHVRLENAIEVA